jgi:hydroxyquinol 1,2-dioxygenase
VESRTRNLTDEALTQAARASFENAESDRLRVILDSLIRHLHGFITDVELTEREWLDGIEFLTETGHITDEQRQEFILLSDVLGASMLVIGLNHRVEDTATESTVFGPFFVEDAPRYENGDDIANGAPGEICAVNCRVLSTGGEPIPGARVDVWQADDAGMYDVQYEDLVVARARGHLFSNSEGRFWFRTIRPTPYPIPTDGPVGRLLRAAGRSPMRPAHIHFRIVAAGYETLTTHVFAADDPFLDTDAVFGVQESLVAPFVKSEDAHCTLEYDFVLAKKPQRPRSRVKPRPSPAGDNS